MASTVLADTSFLIALLNDRDSHHDWAVTQARQLVPPWTTCEAVLSEAFHLLGDSGANALTEMISAGGIVCHFSFADHSDDVIQLLEKYHSVPMSFADACLVRMTEIMPDPVILTTDSDFQVYRRSGRQVVPCVTPR
jgi:predicted nucleic acid-binding protein